MHLRTEATDTATWIKILSRDEAAELQEQAMDRLVGRGILERREKKSLLGRRSRRYLTVDGAAAHEVKERVKALIFSDEIPDPRDIALLSLLDACNILPDIFPGGEAKGAGVRIKQVRKMDLLGRDVVGAVAEIERVLVQARAHGARAFFDLIESLEFSIGWKCDSRFRLVKEASLHDRTSFN